MTSPDKRTVDFLNDFFLIRLGGHFQYYGVPRNSYSMSAFRAAVVRLWYQVISRRSQNGKMSWKRMSRLAKIWLPTARITHPYPEQRLRV